MSLRISSTLLSSLALALGRAMVRLLLQPSDYAKKRFEVLPTCAVIPTLP
jgi:hypothetical protein